MTTPKIKLEPNKEKVFYNLWIAFLDQQEDDMTITAGTTIEELTQFLKEKVEAQTEEE